QLDRVDAERVALVLSPLMSDDILVAVHVLGVGDVPRPVAFPSLNRGWRLSSQSQNVPVTDTASAWGAHSRKEVPPDGRILAPIPGVSDIPLMRRRLETDGHLTSTASVIRARSLFGQPRELAPERIDVEPQLGATWNVAHDARGGPDGFGVAPIEELEDLQRAQGGVDQPIVTNTEGRVLRHLFDAVATFVPR